MTAKAVVLAAGRGTRLCPLTPFLPKEMLPVEGLPVIHHVLKELVSIGITEVMIILSEGKDLIRDYLTGMVSPKGRDAELLSDERARILSSLKIFFAKQEELLGTAHAIGIAASFMGEDPLLVVYPDDLLYDPVDRSISADSTRKLWEICRNTGKSVLMAVEIPGSTASQYGVMRLHARERDIVVTSIVEKPKDYMERLAYALIGRMVITPEIMRSIPKHRMSDGEGIIPVLSEAAANGRLLAVIHKGARYDLGSHRGYHYLLRDLLREEKYIR